MEAEQDSFVEHDEYRSSLNHSFVTHWCVPEILNEEGQSAGVLISHDITWTSFGPWFSVRAAVKSEAGRDVVLHQASLVHKPLPSMPLCTNRSQPPALVPYWCYWMQLPGESKMHSLSACVNYCLSSLNTVYVQILLGKEAQAVGEHLWPDSMLGILNDHSLFLFSHREDVTGLLWAESPSNGMLIYKCNLCRANRRGKF